MGTTELHVESRQSPTSGAMAKVSREFPVSLSRLNIGEKPGVFVELSGIEPLASRVRFWRRGKEVNELASLEVSRHEISRRHHSQKIRKLGGGR